jgi:alpha 1,3-glucosidase
MPPIETLGFHFSKWAEVSADIIIDRNNAFNDNLFPVDVFWMDIEYARDKAYFNFDVDKFPQDKLLEMNQLI